MKKMLVLLLLSCAASYASAYQVETSKRECLRRCGESRLGPASDTFDEKMKSLDAQKKTETNPDKLKALQVQEERETDRYDRQREKICHAICDGNPDD